MIDAIKTAGVLGLGVMGFDIAFLYAQKGYRTLVYDGGRLAALQKVNSALEHGGMKAARLLRALSNEKQTFHKGGQVNPWVAAFIERRGDARD